MLKARLCEQAGGPSRRRITGKPLMSYVKMRIVAPREGQQHVDIGQRIGFDHRVGHWGDATVVRL